MIHFKLDEKEKALKNFNIAYSIDPNSSVLSSKAAVYIPSKPLLAIDILKAIQIDPFNGNAY